MCWTAVSTGEKTMIADSRIVRRERFLANVTTRRAIIRLPLLFRQYFLGTLANTVVFTRCAKSLR